MADVKYDDSGLKDLINALKKDYFVRVGIIGAKAGKVEKEHNGLTNAELGTIHEFGSKDGKHPPRRSFLEDSLKFRLNFQGAQGSVLKSYLFKTVFEKKSPQMFLQELGAKCLLIIEEGFNTNGFGMWKPLSWKLFTKRYDKAVQAYDRLERAMLKGKKPFDLKMLDDYLEQVKRPQILTDSGKLRKSISFKVMRRK